MSTKSKITLLLVMTSLVGAFVFGLLSYLDSRESLRDAAFDELTAIRTARAAQVEDYFESVFDEANVITENPAIRQALVRFRQGFADLEADPDTDVELEALERYYERRVLPGYRRNLGRGKATAESFMPKSRAGRHLQSLYLVENPNPPGRYAELADTGGTSPYERAHADLHDDIRFIRDEFGYYDVFLIDVATGDIVYSVAKEPDFATNIYDGPYRGSDLADLVERVVADPTRQSVHITDAEFYLPSDNSPAVFVGSSIYEGERVAGVLAIQLTLDDLNAIMTAGGDWKSTGLKSTGETYLVNSDGTLLNESRFFVEDRGNYLEALREADVPEDVIADIDRRGSSILRQPVDTEASREAFSGQSDTRVVEDYRGVSVLSAYRPIRVDDHEFALLAEIDASEAFAPVRDLSRRMAVTTAIVIPLTALLGLWLSGVLMRPARVMRETARDFVGGNEEAEFQHQSTDEWGQLGQELNKVVDTAKVRLEEADASRAEIADMTTRLMPTAIGDRFSQGERQIVSHEAEASCAYIMLVPDPKMMSLDDPVRSRELYEELDDRLDQLAAKDGVDMLNQAGMHYVAFCGLTSPLKNHPERLYRFLGHARRTIAKFNSDHETTLRAKVGFATAPMFGALVGNYSMAYEVWGNAVLRAIDLAHAAKTGDLLMTDHAAKLVGVEQEAERVRANLLSNDKIAGRHFDGFMDN